jgi:hypothetical protein
MSYPCICGRAISCQTFCTNIIAYIESLLIQSVLTTKQIEHLSDDVLTSIWTFTTTTSHALVCFLHLTVSTYKTPWLHWGQFTTQRNQIRLHGHFETFEYFGYSNNRFLLARRPSWHQTMSIKVSKESAAHANQECHPCWSNRLGWLQNLVRIWHLNSGPMAINKKPANWQCKLPSTELVIIYIVKQH